MFHTLYRGDRDTRLCSLISYRLLLSTHYGCSVPIVLLYIPYFTLLLHSLLLPPPTIYQVKIRLFPPPPPYLLPNAFSDPSHSSNSDRVSIYCAIVFWNSLMYYSIVKNPSSSRAVAAEVYIQFLSGVLCGSCLVSHLGTCA